MNYITEKERLENEIGSLKIQNNFMKKQIIDLELEKRDLQKRLLHLLQSEIIRSFDELDLNTGKHKRDIKEADEIAKPVRHGHWFTTHYEMGGVIKRSVCVTCSKCKGKSDEATAFCSNCDSKIDEEAKK